MKNYLKKEKIDWLDEQPYFSKYFIYKLKRLIMNVVYKVWNLIDETMLEKYYAELKFWNEDKTFEATMPFIILCKSHKEAEEVIGQINESLVTRYGFIVFKAVAEEQIVTPELYKKKEKELLDKLKSLPNEKVGTITFESHIGTKTKPTILPFQLEDEYVEKKAKLSHSKINFPIIRNSVRKKAVYQVDAFTVIVKLLNEEKPKL